MRRNKGASLPPEHAPAEDDAPFSERRAGLLPDELLPGESNEQSAGDRLAAGTAGGGLAEGGLAGSNLGDGSPDEAELEEATAAGIYDDLGNEEGEADEPQAGHAGGAVGGTPAGKRASFN